MEVSAEIYIEPILNLPVKNDFQSPVIENRHQTIL
jgi:hypothetical protein